MPDELYAQAHARMAARYRKGGIKAAMQRLRLELDELEGLRRVRSLADLLIQQLRLMELYSDESEEDTLQNILFELEEEIAASKLDRKRLIYEIRQVAKIKEG